MYPKSLANLVVEVGTRHSHRIPLGRVRAASLVTKCRQTDNIIVTGGTVSCQNDNLRSHQWRRCCQFDDLLLWVNVLVPNIHQTIYQNPVWFNVNESCFNVNHQTCNNVTLTLNIWPWHWAQCRRRRARWPGARPERGWGLHRDAGPGHQNRRIRRCRAGCTHSPPGGVKHDLLLSLIYVSTKTDIVFIGGW